MTDLDIIAAVLDHARAHALVDTIGSVGVVDGTAHVYAGPGFGRERRDRFVRWCRSVGASVVETDTYYHRASGVLVDGTRVEVRVSVYACDEDPPADVVAVDLDEFEAVTS